MDKSDRKLEYIYKMRPLLQKEALFHDETELFLSPMEAGPGEEVTIRFRTAAHNADKVLLHIGGEALPMEKESSLDEMDFYACRVRAGEEVLKYYFEIRLGQTVCFFDRHGLAQEAEDPCCFRIIPGFSTPDWAKGAVMYQIFVDRFRNGDPSNDVETGEYWYNERPVRKAASWDQLPEAVDVGNFYGGDLQGILDKLDYLQDLGVQVLYLNPVFVSASNHKYDTQDYDHIDPHFGRIAADAGGLLEEGDRDNRHAEKYITRVTDPRNLEESDRLFIRLVEELHARGMKIILDGVFNHCGSFNKWMDREGIYEGRPGFAPGAYHSADSPYRSYFQFADEQGWPENGSYDGWWGYKTLPKLNYEASEELQEEVLRIARKWVSPPFCADGWRLDVAADLGHSEKFNHAFWRKFRQAVKEANPDAVILAEHYGDASSWLDGSQWDSVMNYDAFMEPVSWFLTGMEKHSDEYREDLLGNADSFREAMRHHTASFPMPSLLSAMNELDNHDHSRFLTRTNHRVGRLKELGSEAASADIDPAVLREAVVIQMTWPGAPTLYYGDEAGVCGFTDPDNRRPYPWGKEDDELIRFYRSIIRVHRTHSALQRGSVIPLFRDYNVLVYGRFDAHEQLVIAINNRTVPYELKTPVWQLGLPRIREEVVLTEIFRTDENGFSEEEQPVLVSWGTLTMELASESAVVLWRKV